MCRGASTRLVVDEPLKPVPALHFSKQERQNSRRELAKVL